MRFWLITCCLIALAALFTPHNASSSKKPKKARPLKRRKRIAAARKAKAKSQPVLTDPEREDNKDATSPPPPSSPKEASTPSTIVGTVIDTPFRDSFTTIQYTGTDGIVRLAFKGVDETSICTTFTPSTASTAATATMTDKSYQVHVATGMNELIGNFDEACKIAAMILGCTLEDK